VRIEPGALSAAQSRSVAWVLVSTTHYHHARMSAFAELWPHRATIVQITDTDSVRALEARPESAPYDLHTLLPGVPTSLALRQRIGPLIDAALHRLRPGVVCINGWSFGGAIEALRWSRRNGARAIVMSESSEGDEPRRWWKERMKRQVVALCSAALVGGSLHAAYLESLGAPRERIFDGYDAVDNGHFRNNAETARRDPAAARTRLALPGRYFLAACRFEEKKNLPRLIQAFAEYRAVAGASAWNLAILGDGEMRPALERQAAALGLNGHLHMPGFAAYNDLPAWYALAECFIHASVTEQWGLVVNEAMASGTPALVSKRCGCCPDLLREGRNGYSFDPFDAPSLARLMLRVQREEASAPAMGAESAAIIAEWGPARFARNLSQAAECALGAVPRRRTLAEEAMLAALCHV